MKRKTIDQSLIASRPDSATNSAFVERTMQAIRRQSGAETFDAALRITKVPKKESLFMKYKHLPKFAMVAIAFAVLATIGGTVYAAVRWLEPRITITTYTELNDEQKRQYTVDVKDCGVQVGGATVENGIMHYEIAPKATISDAQVTKAIKDSCNFQQLENMINKRWANEGASNPDAKPGDVIEQVSLGVGEDNVMNDPPIGKITALSANSITITTTTYSTFEGPGAMAPTQANSTETNDYVKYYPQGKQFERVLPLASSLEIYEDGKTIAKSSLAVGDTVAFMTKQSRTVLADGSWSDASNATAIRLFKTGIDPAYVMNQSIGNPAITNAITRLQGCQNNGQYLCIAPKFEDFRYDYFYAYSKNMATPVSDTFANNEKYFRKDIDFMSKDAGKYMFMVQGRIAAIDGTDITLVTRGDKAKPFTITLPYDAISQYNKQHRDGIKKGSYIEINYVHKPNQKPTAIASSDIYSMSLIYRIQANGTLSQY